MILDSFILVQFNKNKIKQKKRNINRLPKTTEYLFELNKSRAVVISIIQQQSLQAVKDYFTIKMFIIQASL